MKRFVFPKALLISVIIIVSMLGCSSPETETVPMQPIITYTPANTTTQQPQTPQQPEVIQAIRVFRITNARTPAPSNDWAAAAASPNPHPAEVQEVFSQNDRMFLGIKINPQFASPTRFSKFTYYNRESGQENQIGYTPGNTGPFEPGQTVLLSFANPFTVPNDIGTYEIRIYVGDKVVASAVFRVKTAVVARIWVWKGMIPSTPVMSGYPYPHPIDVQLQLSQNDSIFLIMGINYGHDQNVTFSRFTFFDIKSGIEQEIHLPADLSPLTPGQQTALGVRNPWHVPNETGVYEIRLYQNSEVVGSAVFEVVPTLK